MLFSFALQMSNKKKTNDHNVKLLTHSISVSL